ncbi:MAG TPA: acyltransferase [Steroidobacteraceae bacterium]|nr:acyltransferase [Steroidobacteraceae bacterium]
MKEPRNFNVALNGYRGLCALLVFGFHLGSAGVVAWPSGSALADEAASLWMSLAYGVDMFFMISGFVIVASLARHATVGGFLRDRFVRIFSAWVPTVIAVTAICLAFHMKVFADVSLSEGIGIFVANLLLLPPLLPIPLIHMVSWSLTYEWVFYLTAAAGALIRRHIPHRLWVTALWAAFIVGFIAFYPRAVYFLTGVLVYRHQDWFVRHSRWLRFPALSFVVFLVAWRATGIDQAQLDVTWPALLVSGRWLLAVIAFAASVHLFASVCLSADRQTAFLETRTFQFLGAISYSFYLWHALVMAFVKRVMAVFVAPEAGDAMAFALFAVLSLGIALAVSWSSWALFEVRLAKRMRRWLTQRDPIGSAVHAR